MLLKVGFHSCLFAGLGGRPADHMELLGLQISRPQSKFNLLLPSCFPLSCTLASHYSWFLLRDSAGVPLKGETAILFPLLVALSELIQHVLLMPLQHNRHSYLSVYSTSSDICKTSIFSSRIIMAHRCFRVFVKLNRNKLIQDPFTNSLCTFKNLYQPHLQVSHMFICLWQLASISTVPATY